MSRSKLVQIDMRQFQSKARKWLKQMGKSEKEFVSEQGGLYARDLAKVTPPHGAGQIELGKKTVGSKHDEAAGERAILQDMAIVFNIREQGYLEFLIDVAGRRTNIRQTLRTKTGKTYLVDVDVVNPYSVAQAYDWIEGKRRRDGRVSGLQGGKKAKEKTIGRWVSRDVMWITPYIWNAVAERKKENVGIAKSGLLKASLRINPSPAKPKWVARHLNKVSGNGRVAKNRLGYRAHIRASAGGYQHTRKQFIFVANYRRNAAVRRLKHLAKPPARRAGFKVR